eukprot:m.273914 g.273914  ORF g.273914 m.273914 type:complete len:544 (-) comp11090_c1_seq46:449-2080(-)
MVGLTAADYAVLGVHIALSAAVGLLVGRKQHSGESYFLAGRSANGVAIAVSLLSGVASGISYLGIPGYAYSDGMGFVFSVLSYPISLGFAAFAIIPFFHSLGMCTAYAYLEARFSRAVRTAAALVFVLRVVVYLSVVLYAPALALAALTGLPIWLTIVVIGSIATPYTIKGGMAAVLWTDFLQSLMMIVCAVLMAAVANSRIGGAAGVMREMKRGERTVTAEFFEPNPTRSERPAETFWSMVVGYSVISLAQLSTDQIVVQRYMTAKSAQECRRSVLLNGVLQLVFSSMLNYLGWSLYAYYHERTARTGAPDPLAAGDIASSDQLSAYFALTELPKGMAGLLIAAVLGSTMSVFSGGVNAAATSCYVDLMEGRLGLRHSAARVARSELSAGAGDYCACVCCVVDPWACEDGRHCDVPVLAAAGGVSAGDAQPAVQQPRRGCWAGHGPRSCAVDGSKQHRKLADGQRRSRVPHGARTGGVAGERVLVWSSGGAHNRVDGLCGSAMVAGTRPEAAARADDAQQGRGTGTRNPSAVCSGGQRQRCC